MLPQATDYPCLRRVAVYEWLRGEWRDHNVHCEWALCVICDPRIMHVPCVALA